MYNIVRFLSLTNSFLQLHQSTFLLADNRHSIFDLTIELAHGHLDVVYIVAIDVELIVEFVSFYFEAFDVWVRTGLLLRSFWKTC